MPVIFEEVVAQVVPAQPPAAEEPPAEAPGKAPPDARAVRCELRRLARRAGRLHAD